MKRVPFRLVPDEMQHDVVADLKKILADAEKGKVIGVSYAVMCRGGSYFVDSAGEAFKSPTFAIGMAVVQIASQLKRVLG